MCGKHRRSQSGQGRKDGNTENYRKNLKAPNVRGKLLSRSCAAVTPRHRRERTHAVPAAEAVSAGGKRSPAGWRNVLGKHCWPRRVLLFSLEYDQLCGQRSSRDVVGLMQSWSGLFQQTAWFRVSFWFFVRFFFFLENVSQAKAIPVQQFSGARLLWGVTGADSNLHQWHRRRMLRLAGL